jgi:Zn-dependent protease
MNHRAISLGRIFGIPIELDYSWFLVFALVAWTLAAGYFPAEFKNWPAAEYWIVGIITAVLFFVSVLLHELGHSVVARHFRIPVTSIKLFIFGGVSQIGTEPPSAGVEFVMAIVGPLVSFGLAGIFALLQLALASFTPAVALTKYLAYINVVLGAFNLIPGFPLDGGRVLRSIVWGWTHDLQRATFVAGTAGRTIGFLFILFGVWQVIAGNFINGLWIGFIGWFLESAAGSQMQQQQVHGLLAGHKVSEAMSRDYTAIQPSLTLQQLVDEHILGGGRRSFVVQENSHVDGLLTLHDIKEVSRDTWPTTTARQIMVPLARVKRTEPQAELWGAIEEMERDGVNQLPVMIEGRMVGMLRRQDIVSYLQALRELGR